VLIGEPPRTPYDLNFHLGQFPIRVTPWFWLVALLMSGSANNVDRLPPWILAVFTSILIHELGHAVAFFTHGIRSHVVLYHFGGLAIPDGYGSAAGGRDSRSRIVISVAGPMAQLTGAAIIVVVLLLMGREIPLGGFVADILQLPIGFSLEPRFFGYFIEDFLYVSTYWALLNLLPVYPLDGGHISREFFLIFDRRDPIKHSLMLSMLTGGFLAIWSFSRGNNHLYLGILFGMLAYSSYAALQAYSGPGSGFGRRS
jgi:Zn-dependent protease